jgi:hypothetical protein
MTLYLLSMCATLQAASKLLDDFGLCWCIQLYHRFFSLAHAVMSSAARVAIALPLAISSTFVRVSCSRQREPF